MNQTLLALQPTRPVSMREQIQTHVRDLIRDGKLPPGTRLPTTAELAREWSTHPATVQASLSPLVKEGLLERQAGVGTFVREQSPALRVAGIYYRHRGTGYEGGFNHHMFYLVSSALAARGVRVESLVDCRDDVSLPMPELVSLAQSRQLDGVIAWSLDRQAYAWLSAQPVVNSVLSSDNRNASRVTIDWKQFIDLALADLASQGCHSVGIISTYPRANSNADGSTHDHSMYHRYLLRSLKESGMNLLRNCAIAPDREGIPSEAVTAERLGYHLTRDLVSKQDLPDGLIIDNDLVAKGAISAFLEAGVKIPSQLKLVMQGNRGLPILCPYPVTILEVDLPAVATALIEQVDKQLRGLPVQTIAVSVSTIRHQPAAPPDWLWRYNQ